MSFSEPKNFPSGWGVQVCSNIWVFLLLFIKVFACFNGSKMEKKTIIPLFKVICNIKSSHYVPKNKNV
jgi:hypothetical protein